jgi:putative tricarboxylic transport membrane protein
VAILRKPDFIWGILGVLLSLYVFWKASSFPDDSVLLLGPAFFPMLLAGGMLIVSLGMICLTVFTKYGEGYPEFKLTDAGTIRMLLTLISSVAYYFLMPMTGFILGSILYLVFLMKLLKVQGNVKVLLLSGVITMTIYGIFGWGLNIALPPGKIF